MSKHEFEIGYESGDPEFPRFCMPVAWEEPNMINPKEKVVDENEITIVFEYPLSKKAEFTYKSKNGFTRKKVWQCIHKGYKKIYKEEDQDAGETDLIPGMYNRQSSSGRWGIWGHVIEDLVVEGVYKKGKKYYLNIGS